MLVLNLWSRTSEPLSPPRVFLPTMQPCFRSMQMWRANIYKNNLLNFSSANVNDFLKWKYSSSSKNNPHEKFSQTDAWVVFQSLATSHSADSQHILRHWAGSREPQQTPCPQEDSAWHLWKEHDGTDVLPTTFQRLFTQRIFLQERLYQNCITVYPENKVNNYDTRGQGTTGQANKWETPFSKPRKYRSTMLPTRNISISC